MAVCNIGDMMYAEAPDVAPGRILDLPLLSPQQPATQRVQGRAGPGATKPNVLVNTHATFRWRHGLFYAFDYDQMKALDADLYVCWSTTSTACTTASSATGTSTTRSRT